MRLILALFALALVTLQLELWFGEERRPALVELSLSVAEQSAENRRLAEINADLAAEIRNLKLGTEAAEERARSELGLLQAGESFFQIYEVSPPATAP